MDASCNATVTVTCLKELYNAVGYTPRANSGNTVACTGYLDQFASLADLQSFFKDQVPAAVNSTFKLVSINGQFPLQNREHFTHKMNRWSEQPEHTWW